MEMSFFFFQIVIKLCEHACLKHEPEKNLHVSLWILAGMQLKNSLKNTDI